MKYATLDDLKHRLSSDEITMSDKWDDVLNQLLDEVSRTIDRMIAQQRGIRGAWSFVAEETPSPRLFSRRGSRSTYLPIQDCVEVVEVEIRLSPGGGYTPYAGYSVHPLSERPIVGIVAQTPWPHGEGAVRVAARWGFTEEVPDDIRQITIEEAVRAYQGGRTGYDDRIGVTPFGTAQLAKAFTDKTRRTINDYGYGGGFMRAGG